MENAKHDLTATVLHFTVQAAALQPEYPQVPKFPPSG